MTSEATTPGNDHTVAVVVPVCRAENMLPTLLEELDRYVSPEVSSAGNRFRVSQVVLVHDAGPDQSDRTIRVLAERYDYVRPVWLARNFGQHAATLAGMSSTSADWIVTMDEDGQHDPAAIGAMLDTALSTRSPLVYAEPIDEAPPSGLRKLAGRVVFRAARLVGGDGIRHYHGYRLVLGEVGRGLAAYCGESVHLDVALIWVVNRTASCPVATRGRTPGSSFRNRASHFWRMVLTSGTRPLRLVALFAAFLGVVAVGLMGWVVWSRFTDQVSVQGWTSILAILLVTSGGILLSLSIVAEYLGIAARSAMGKPLYLVVSDPADGPLGRVQRAATPVQPGSSEPPPPVEPAVRAER